jgi:hypothetical protein
MYLTSVMRNDSTASCVVHRLDLGLLGIASGTSRLDSLAYASADFAAHRLEKMYQRANL